MKKTIVCMLVSCMIVSLVGCGNQEVKNVVESPKVSENLVVNTEQEEPTVEQNPMSDNVGSIAYGSFSFADVLKENPEGTPGVRFDGFVNVEQNVMDGFDGAIERAKSELSQEYNSIKVYYDEDMDIWAVHFFHSQTAAGGGRTVYIDGNGITRLIVSGE